MALSHPEASGPTRPRQPVTLLESVSPYGSRKVTVEYDGLTTAAYLHDDTVRDLGHLDRQPPARARVHRPGPARRRPRAADARRADQAPRRPRAAAGRALEALWFEEGDGVAIFENGRPLAVIAGWSDMDRGHARLQPRRDRPDAVRLVAGRRHGRARAPAGAVPVLLALAAVGRRLGAVPAGPARPPAAPARPGRALLGRLGGQPAADRRDRTAVRARAARTRCCPPSA